MSGRQPKTSESHPIRVDFVPSHELGVHGRLGMTFAPGKRAHGLEGRWERDLDADLRRLKEHYHADRLVSLMEDHEYERYGIAGLHRAAERLGMEVVRLSIPDGGTPSRSEASGYAETVEGIVSSLRRGETVVVHCRGGLGRTGVVAASVLVALGHPADRAIEVVREARGPGAVENERQEEYVRRFEEACRQRGGTPERAQPTALERFRGALLGLAVGDALGAAVEFKSPGSFEPVEDMRAGGPHGLEAGYWTDDASMALCLAESLILSGGFDPADQARRYLRWYREGHMSSTGECFDIGITTRDALLRFESTGEPFSGPTDPDTAGNGSIMRLAPVAMYYSGLRVAVWDEPLGAIYRYAESSRVTHGARAAVDACRYLGVLIAGALNGVDKETLLAGGESHYGSGPMTEDPLCEEVAEVAAGSFKHHQPPRIQGSGYVVRSLEAALWAFYHSRSFREGALLAVNLGDDADTTGAVYGQLAGAYYGEGEIPKHWRGKLAHRLLIEHFAERLHEMSQSVDWQKLLEFLPHFERPDFEFGRESTYRGYGLTNPKTGEFTPFTYYDLSDISTEFLKTLYSAGVVYGFDWSEYQERARRLYERPELLEEADEDELRKLLTLHARKDRFAEGHFGEMLRSGHITQILQRLAELRGAEDRSSQ